MRIALFAATVLLALASGVSPSCAAPDASGSAREGDWVEADVVVPSERILRQVAVQAMSRNGFPPGTEASKAQSMVSSGWKVDLQPFKGDGTRAKAFVEYEEKNEREWHVYVRVLKETNGELAKPLELAKAKWESGPDDTESASRILRLIQMVLAPPAPDPSAAPARAGG
jgi:hypothetical protein